jgi:hypothetical protein
MQLNILYSILQVAPRIAPRGLGIGGLIFGTVVAVSILLVSVGFFYVLLKLGRYLDAMKEKV